MGETAFDILNEHYQRDPEQVVLILKQADQPDLPIHYRELIQSAAGYARALDTAGIQPGEVVILILPHGLDLIGAFWGAVLHGAVPSIMPFLTEKLLPERYRHDLAALLRVTRPAAVITDPDFEAEVNQANSGADGPVRAVLLCATVEPCAEPRFDQMQGRLRQAGDIVFLQHSSGSTGLQKGVAITHQALLNQLASYSQAIRLSREDVIVSWLPLYHDMGLIAGFLLPILRGIPLVLMSPFDWVRDPAQLLRAVSEYHGTLSWLPNFAYNFCAQKIRDSQMADVNLSSWRAVINCSEPMFEQSFSLFAQRFAPYGLRRGALATSYAMAENVFGVTQGGIDSPVMLDVVDALALQAERLARPALDGLPQVKMLSCGKPIPGTEVKVLDDQGRALPERQVGELAVRSNCMLAGYYNRPEETAKIFVDGWYRTGDLGYLAEGEVYVTGRKKDLIIVSGRNIFPQDIEAAANEVAGVHPGRVVAFGILNEALGTEEVALVAEVDLPEGRDVAVERAVENGLRIAINQNTSISVKYIQLVGPHWLVKTSSGKIARAANREKFIAEFLSRA